MSMPSHARSRSVSTNTAKPHVLLAQTTFGKGVSFMENTIAWHYLPMSNEQYAQAIGELEEQPEWSAAFSAARAPAAGSPPPRGCSLSPLQGTRPHPGRAQPHPSGARPHPAGRATPPLQDAAPPPQGRNPRPSRTAAPTPQEGPGPRRNAFIGAVQELAERDPRVVFLTGDLSFTVLRAAPPRACASAS